eukprot:m.64506 g.64506  ORF g.64506 m.64506 type:complete len:59 (+) comp13497_c0_seq5:527-703(+)
MIIEILDKMQTYHNMKQFPSKQNAHRLRAIPGNHFFTFSGQAANRDMPRSCCQIIVVS